jgi:hypothetical protein
MLVSKCSERGQCADVVSKRVDGRSSGRQTERVRPIMAWVLFEVLLAFGLAIFIVWWTLPKEKKRKRKQQQNHFGESAQRNNPELDGRHDRPPPDK